MLLTDDAICKLEIIRHQEKWTFSLETLLNQILKERIEDNKAKENMLNDMYKMDNLIGLPKILTDIFEEGPYDSDDVDEENDINKAERTT